VFLHPLIILLVAPGFAVMLVVRRLAARALGMKDVRLFSGAVADGPAVTLSRRAAVLLASLGASYLVAGVLFACAVAFGGSATRGTTVAVLPGKPAALAGMRDGDRPTSVAGKPVSTWTEMAAEIAAHAEEPIEIVADRGGAEVRIPVTPRGAKGAGKVGIASPDGLRRPPASAREVLQAALLAPAEVLVAVGRGYLDVATGNGSTGELQGATGVVRAAANAGKKGLAQMLDFVAVMAAYAWPLTACAAIALTPRRRRPALRRAAGSADSAG
jgi:membrane-associated protease RseP (regulator of RpoE activity)